MQLKGFSPECFRMCVFRLVAFVQEYLHWLQLWDFSICKVFFRLFAISREGWVLIFLERMGSKVEVKLVKKNFCKYRSLMKVKVKMKVFYSVFLLMVYSVAT